MKTINKLVRFLTTPLRFSVVDGAGDPPAGGGGGDAGTPPPSTDLRTFIDEKGGLKPGWAKSLGAPEEFEKKYTSLQAAFGAHGSAVQMIGKDKIVLPGENATAEDWAAFYGKVGRPEKADDYGLAKPKELADNLWDDARMKSFTAQAHAAGLSKKQVEALVAWELGNVQKAVGDYEAASAKTRAEAEAELKTEWGARYDANLSAAREAARKMGAEKLLSNEQLANNPDLMRVFANVAAAISEETSAAGARQPGGQIADNPKEEAMKIMNDMSGPYWNREHPQHASTVERVQKLFAAAHPEVKK